jgi:hypothetical protein
MELPTENNRGTWWLSSRGTLDIALLDGSSERFAIDNYFFQLCGSIVPSLVNAARQRLAL